MDEITTEEQLRALLGEPVQAALAKERTALADVDREWLAASPFCLVATSGADGSCDDSPKGDPPGFTLVRDDRTIALPERAGNRRADGYRRNIPHRTSGWSTCCPAAPTRCGSTAAPAWSPTESCSTGWS